MRRGMHQSAKKMNGARALPFFVFFAFFAVELKRELASKNTEITEREGKNFPIFRFFAVSPVFAVKIKKRRFWRRRWFGSAVLDAAQRDQRRMR